MAELPTLPGVVLVGIGYTLATGRLFCPIAEWHEYAERILRRPILTHEFADKRLWAELRETFEQRVTDGALLDSPGGR